LRIQTLAEEKKMRRRRKKKEPAHSNSSSRGRNIEQQQRSRADVARKEERGDACGAGRQNRGQKTPLRRRTAVSGTGGLWSRCGDDEGERHMRRKEDSLLVVRVCVFLLVVGRKKGGKAQRRRKEGKGREGKGVIRR